LIFDKRGVGASTGDWRVATLEDLAADGAAAVAFLRGQPRINSARIGVHGHSQGATIAPIVAARSSVAFVIGSAAAGLPADSIEVFSVLNAVYPEAASAQDSADASEYVRELVAVAYSESRACAWTRSPPRCAIVRGSSHRRHPTTRTGSFRRCLQDTGRSSGGLASAFPCSSFTARMTSACRRPGARNVSPRRCTARGIPT